MDAEYSVGLIHLLTVGSVINYLPRNAADVGTISESKRCPGEGMTTHSRITAWEIPWIERGDWRATVCDVAKSKTWLSDYTTANNLLTS